MRDNEGVFCYMSVDGLVAILIDILDTFDPLNLGLIRKRIDELRI